MKKNILLTGEIQIGKSTIINKIIEKYFKNKLIVGFKTLPFYQDGKIKGYYIEDQLEKGIVANDKNIVGQVLEKEQRCFGIKETFENKGVYILNNALDSNGELILMDELGFFENDSEYFKNRVRDVLENKIKVIGVLKKKDTEFLNSIKERSDILLIEVNKENREIIEEKIKNYWNL